MINETIDLRTHFLAYFVNAQKYQRFSKFFENYFLDVMRRQLIR